MYEEYDGLYVDYMKKRASFFSIEERMELNKINDFMKRHSTAFCLSERINHFELDRLWRWFSGECYSETFMIVNEDIFENFVEWLSDESWGWI